MNGILNKECSKCKVAKPVDEFKNHGKSVWCKQCMRDYAKQYYHNHREKCINYSKQYFKDNSEKLKEYARKWNNENKERIDKRNTKYRNDNREAIREKKREWDRKAMLNPMHRLSNNLRGNMYHALKGKKGFKKWEDLVGYTLQDLINHLTPLLNNTTMTWDNYGITWHVDHITPKSWFKYVSTDDPKFKECWALSNLQPKLRLENISKGNRFKG